jgi:hypothetical protein
MSDLAVYSHPELDEVMAGPRMALQRKSKMTAEPFWVASQASARPAPLHSSEWPLRAGGTNGRGGWGRGTSIGRLQAH